MFTSNQKLRVRSDHEFHPARIGYFFYLGEESRVVVLAETDDTEMCQTYFAVKLEDVKEFESSTTSG